MTFTLPKQKKPSYFHYYEGGGGEKEVVTKHTEKISRKKYLIKHTQKLPPPRKLSNIFNNSDK